MKEIKGKRAITIPEVRDILAQLDPEKTDQLQKRTRDFAEKFAKADAKEAGEAVRQLVEDCSLTEEEATELVNILPKTLPELRVFTAGWKKLIPSETLEKISKILKSSAK